MNITEKELMRIALNGVRSILNKSVRYNQARLQQEAIDHQISNLNAWWKINLKSKKALITIADKELNLSLPEFIHEAMPSLERNASDLIMDIKKKETIRKIQISGAKAQIDEILSKEDLRYTIYEQIYRFKLYIYIGSSTKIVLPIKYKDLPNSIQNILPAVQMARQLVEDFGKDVKIN